MPMYDRKCHECQTIKEDCWESMSANEPIPCKCGGKLVRVILSHRQPSVIGDDIPGGVLIENAICNPDGTPKRYYSKSEIARAAEAAGWTPTGNKHVPDNRESDKSKATTRWY